MSAVNQITIDHTIRNEYDRYSVCSDHGDETKHLLDDVLGQLDLDAIVNGYRVCGMRLIPSLITRYLKKYVAKRHRQEMDIGAELIGVDPLRLRAGNLYYDIVSASMKVSDVSDLFKSMGSLVLPGCTAFAFDTREGPVHCRNLDWPSPSGALSEFTAITNHRYHDGEVNVVGWPGLTGVFSGMKPGAFSITLNSVMSDDFALGKPVTLLIREVLEECETFDDAVERLCRETIIGDCLLMVVGTRPGEMVVIERSSKQFRIRRPRNGFIVCTNDYLALRGSGHRSESEIAATSCYRYTSIAESLNNGRPASSGECFNLLDEARMGITMQQMLFCPSSGKLKVKKG